MLSTRGGKQLLIDTYARLQSAPEAPMRLHQAIESGSNVLPLLEGHPDLQFRFGAPRPVAKNSTLVVGPKPFESRDMVQLVCGQCHYTSLGRLSATCKWMRDNISLETKIKAYEAFCERFGRFQLLDETTIRFRDSQLLSQATLRIETRRLRLELGAKTYTAPLGGLMTHVNKNRFPPNLRPSYNADIYFRKFVLEMQNPEHHDDLQIWFQSAAPTTHGDALIGIFIRSPLIVNTTLADGQWEPLPVEFWAWIGFDES